MPIHKNPDGTWQWGKSGKKYKNKEDAVKQMKAIFANGYVEKKAALSQQQLKQRVAPYYTEDRKRHIQDVLKYAKKLKGKQLSPLQLAIIYYHDIQKKRVGGVGHQEAGAKFAQKDLKKFYTKDQVHRVAQAIRQHNPDYRLSRKNFRHSSPQAQLLALADDMNIRHRDPDNMVKISVKFIKNHPQLFPVDPQFGYNRHVSYFGPLHSHKNLKYYKDAWKHQMARPIKEVDNYPRQKWFNLWNKIKADSQIPDIDSVYYNPDNIVYE